MYQFIMAALRSRYADIIFCSYGFFFFFLRSGRILDVYYTSTYDVALMRI